MLIGLNTYSDLPMFFSKNSFTRDINLKKALSSIRESVKNIVLTNSGERPFDSDFGASIYRLLFESVFDAVESFSFKVQLTNTIHRYEPRVSVDEVLISYDTNNRIDITIEYSINSLHTTDKLTISLERTR